MEKINNLLSLFENNEIEALLINSESNIKYLTSFSGDTSVLFVSKKQTVLFTDPRYYEQAQMECKMIEVRLWLNDVRYGYDSYQSVLIEHNISRLGFEANHIALSTYQYLCSSLKNVELISTTGLVEKLRIVKHDYEIQHLRKACEISDRALANTLEHIKGGDTELEITGWLEYYLRHLGADNNSFETIVLAGKRTSLLHGKPSSNKLKSGDFLLFDFGALVNGYHADISRTIILSKPSEEQEKLYDIIKKCQKSIIDVIADGVHIRTINEVIKNTIPDEYWPYFYNGYGHGVGLDIHEEPFMKMDADFVFKKDMVLTVEPGIYIPNKSGLRIEDTILVKETSAEQLSKFSKEIMILS